MLEANGFVLDDDHIDVDFARTADWTRVGPSPDLSPSLFISLGDQVAGPDIQLVTMPISPGELWLDTHYHATDQFRAVIQGGFKLQRRRMGAGCFGYQLPGLPYREGVTGGETEPMWMVMVHGERRGARSTTTRRDGNILVEAFGEDQLDRPTEGPEDPYWRDIPGGHRGRTSLKSSLGRTVGGFCWGDFAQDAGWHAADSGVDVTAATMGDPEVGPLVLTVRAAAGRPVFPARCWETEIALVMVGGSVTAAGESYARGKVRIQAAYRPMPGLVAGDDGAQAVIVIADRRALPAAGDLSNTVMRALAGPVPA